MSSIELVLYTPLLMTITFLAVQLALSYLGNQVASSAAREGARIVRVGGADSCPQAVTKMSATVATIGRGLLTLTGAPTCVVTGAAGAADRSVRVTVDGVPQQVVPFVSFPIRQQVQGPLELFRPDVP